MAVMAPVTTPLMPSQMPTKKFLIPVNTVVAVVFIPLTIFEKKVAMPFQTPSKKVLMPVHTSFQLVPNQERIASAIPLIVPMTAVKIPLIPFQIDEKISFTPVHA